MPDKLDNEIREELKRLGLPTHDRMVQFIRNQHEAGLVIQRIFEPMPHNWESAFKVGDTVELVRPFFGIAPVGTKGVIKEIETNVHPDGSWKEEWELSSDYMKGHPYRVEFDCSQVPLTLEEVRIYTEFCERHDIENIPMHKGLVTTNVGPHDIQKVAL